MTRIEETHEQLLAYRKVTPLGQRAVAQWVETHDGMSNLIEHLFENLREKVLYLTVSVLFVLFWWPLLVVVWQYWM